MMFEGDSQVQPDVQDLSSSEGHQPKYASSSHSDSPTNAVPESQWPELPGKLRKACEGCRRLKVQCHFESSQSEACKRCTKAGRRCIVNERRRRNTITPSTVNELERKLAALTATLDAFKSRSHLQEPNSQTSSDSSTAAGSAKFRARQESLRARTDQTSDLPAAGVALHESRPNVAEGPIQQENHRQGPHPGQNYMNEYQNVIDRGILPLNAAYAAFDHFVFNMIPHFPIVVFPVGTTAASVRARTPILFLASVHVASGVLPLEIQRELNQDIMHLFANRILVIGEKSLELIQALQIVSIWYYPPGRYEELKYYQMIHNACIMAIDIGINRKGKALSSVGLSEITRSSKRPNLSAATSSRAWLGCYFLAAGTAQNLRRENIIRWSSYMDECLIVLEKSPGALPSDEIFCQWIRLQHISDDVSTQFSIEDPAACPSLDDPKMRYAIQGLEGQLRACTSYSLKGLKPATLKLGELCTRLYMHEVALHAGYSNDDMQPPFTEETLRGIRPTQTAHLSAGHISSLSISLSVIHAYFDTFLSHSVDQIRGFPTFHVVRIIYASVVLVKMAFDATIPGSEMQRMFKPNDFRIDYYLDSLIILLKAAAEGNKCASAAKFAMVLFVIKALFHKQSEDRDDVTSCITKGHIEGPKSPIEGRNQQHFACGSRRNSETSYHRQQNISFELAASDEGLDFVASLNQVHLYHPHLLEHDSSNSLHHTSNTANTEQQMISSNSKSRDRFMDDMYDFDPQGFLVNSADFPAYFSNDGLLNSVFQMTPGELYDYGTNNSSN